MGELDVAETKRIVMIDEHRSFAETLQIALSRSSNLRIVGIEETATGGMRRIRRLRPDMVIASQRLNGTTSGLELVSELRTFERLESRTTTPFVLLTSFVTPSLIRKADEIPKTVALSKRSSLDELLCELQHVAIRGRSPGASLSDPFALTPAQQEVLDFLALGFSPSQIADEVGITLHAIRARIRGLLVKTDSVSQLQAVVRGTRAGLVCPI